MKKSSTIDEQSLFTVVDARNVKREFSTPSTRGNRSSFGGQLTGYPTMRSEWYCACADLHLTIAWTFMSAIKAGKKLVLALLTLAAPLLVGCGSATVQQGSQGARCYPDGTCTAGLVCLSDLCVQPAGQGGTSGSSDASGIGGQGESASGGAAGGANGGGGGGALKVYQNVVMDSAMDMVDAGTATGTATVTLNETTGAVSVSGTFSGLTGAATMAHIHGLETSPGVGNEGVIVTLVATAAASGTLTGSGTLTPTEVTGMLNGLTYLNIHTVLHSGGEIRGNIGP
jgi:hypothetical protein